MSVVAIIGAGMMTKPMVEYFFEQTEYEVMVVNRTFSKALELVGDHPRGRAIAWSTEHPEVLDEIMKKADVAISMVPKPVHIHVARACLRHGTHMLTTSYEIPELLALDKDAIDAGILILNELGEVPGLDHFGTQLLLDRVAADGGRVLAVESYGSGLPSFEHNRNPFGYKFSWDPRTMFVAAQTPAAYLVDGERVEVGGDELFEHFWLVDLGETGIYESYPNKDVTKYVKPFGIPEDASFYRGLLRFPGYCNKMQAIMALGLVDNETVHDFSGMSRRDVMAQLIGKPASDDPVRDTAVQLGVGIGSDVIQSLNWLGMFDTKPAGLDKGTYLDVLLDRMLAKMSYRPHERDMILLHIDVLAEFNGGRREQRTAVMRVEGIPHGASAMSRAVGLPAVIAAHAVMEGRLNAVGCHMPPTLPELYPIALEAMSRFGFVFTLSKSEVDEETHFNGRNLLFER